MSQCEHKLLKQHTFGDCQKTNQDECISMCPSYTVVNVTNRRIYWMECAISRPNRYSRFVASKHDWDEHPSVGGWVLTDLVLANKLKTYELVSENKSLLLGPRPNSQT